MLLKLLLWSLLFDCVSAMTLDLKIGDNLTLECTSDCILNFPEKIGMHLYRDAEIVAYYAKKDDLFTPHEDPKRIQKTGIFKKNNITIINVTVEDAGFYRCAFTKSKCEEPCSMYRVVVSEVSTKKECFQPNVPQTLTPIAIITVVIAAAAGIIIFIIFILCVIPKVNKWMRSGESEAQVQNIYEAMSGTGFQRAEAAALRA